MHEKRIQQDRQQRGSQRCTIHVVSYETGVTSNSHKHIGKFANLRQAYSNQHRNFEWILK
jgi:hypothetical protein